MSTTLTVTDDPKMLREALCVAEHAVNRNVEPQNQHGAPRILAALIAECDRHRPLGPDGNHNDRHTATCGCDDVPPAPLDPSKVKAGDTVTAEHEDGDVITAVVKAYEPLHHFYGEQMPTIITKGGFHIPIGDRGAWTLTDHQPAPKPEWEPGMTGYATVAHLAGGNAVLGMRVMRVEWDGLFGFATQTGRIIEDGSADWSVYDLVPDEPRPLPTRAQVASILPQPHDLSTAVLLDNLFALLRGESR